MSVGYAALGPRYMCRSPDADRASGSCWSLAGTRVDQAVVAAFLDVAQPSELELSLAVTAEAHRQADELDRQWRLRLDRARYEAGLAERRYKAVDPDNRNVARTVERDWEQALQDLTEAERLYEAARTARKVQLSDADRARVLALARNLPRVWNAPSTTDADRKSLLRTLVLGVTLTPVDVPRRQTRIQILWEGGAVTEIRAERPRCGPSATPSTTLEARIRCLVEQGTSDHEIARILNPGYSPV